MSKRTAGTELNHDNWDDEDEQEEAGTFQPVSEKELKTRIIKKAKRSLTGANAGKSPFQGSSPFAAFSGFNNSTTPFTLTKKSDSAFSGQSPLSKKDETVIKVENGKSSDSFDNKTKESIKVSQTSNTSSPKPSRNIEYYRQLQSLNESVFKWMQLHLAKNPCCDFTPVFNDYKKHLDTLNVTYPVKKKEISSPAEEKSSGIFKTPVSSVSKFVQKSGSKVEKSDANSSLNTKGDDETDYGANFSARTTNTSTFSFGMKTTPSATSSITPSGPTSSSKEEEKVPDQKPFQFTFSATPKTEGSTVSKGFSFASAIASAKSSETANEPEEKDYEPPKNEFVKVSEDDALYSIRCKLFFKKGDAYADKGVGTLYLKSLEGKTQLLVRADTSLGNILLNIMLNASLPMSRTGKNNVLLVCVPNPPVDAKNPDSKEAIPMLIRVKTAEDADALLDVLNKHKS